ncbi:HIT-type Zinc finger family protein isoform 2 [Zea mays]|uniref:HIT-type Zinc finger family protein isoform 2 n=1 Tax=Zea mays TaxID=4577 RepID=UPI000C6C44C5|nr:HIT-type Zinc finger family protein isoform 2 [Zea mays]|eukprot:XP_023157693.1 HIT-type Zinc finger family protein isoform X1 [Zea mays]
MGDGSCCVCKEAPPKYKCPSCRTPYCSVTCFKKHKALHTTCTAESPNTACPTKALEVEDLSWLVDNNRLRSLAELKGIQDALRDPELQRMILQIDGSSESEKELEKVMEGQAFREFTDKILDIVNPQE